MHEVGQVFQLRMLFQTQMPISLVTLVFCIQAVYVTVYTYTIVSSGLYARDGHLNHEAKPSGLSLYLKCTIQ